MEILKKSISIIGLLFTSLQLVFSQFNNGYLGKKNYVELGINVNRVASLNEVFSSNSKLFKEYNNSFMDGSQYQMPIKKSVELRIGRTIATYCTVDVGASSIFEAPRDYLIFIDYDDPKKNFVRGNISRRRNMISTRFSLFTQSERGKFAPNGLCVFLAPSVFIQNTKFKNFEYSRYLSSSGTVKYENIENKSKSIIYPQMSIGIAKHALLYRSLFLVTCLELYNPIFSLSAYSYFNQYRIKKEYNDSKLPKDANEIIDRISLSPADIGYFKISLTISKVF